MLLQECEFVVVFGDHGIGEVDALLDLGRVGLRAELGVACPAFFGFAERVGVRDAVVDAASLEVESLLDIGGLSRRWNRKRHVFPPVLAFAFCVPAVIVWGVGMWRLCRKGGAFPTPFSLTFGLPSVYVMGVGGGVRRWASPRRQRGKSLAFALARAALAVLSAEGGEALRRSVGKRSIARTRSFGKDAAGRRQGREVVVEPREVPVRPAAPVAITVVAFVPLMAFVASPGLIGVTRRRWHVRREVEAAAVVLAEREICSCHRQGCPSVLTIPPIASVAGSVTSLVQRRDEDA